jgi:RecA-family ATPase
MTSFNQKDLKQSPQKLFPEQQWNPQGMSLAEIQALNIKPARMFKDWLPEGITLLAGRPKAGKSGFVERASVELSDEMPVLHFALEYNELMLKSRMNDFEWTPAQNLTLYHGACLPRLNKGGLKILEKEIEKHQAELVVLDTLAKVKREGDAKGYEAEYAAIGDLFRLREATGVSILFVHHTRKPNNQEPGDIFDRILGSTALAAVPDNLLIISDEDRVKTLHGRGRLTEDFELPLKWADPGFSVDEPDAKLREKAPLQFQIKHHLRRVGGATNKEIAEALEKPVTSISNATAKLVDAGEIKQQTDKKFIITT